MLLFYSNHCSSSRMLVDSIKRYNGTDFIKLVNIDVYLAKKIKIPTQIHSVPAILFPSKNIIFGKQVFDYLLLPGKGFLFNLPKKESTQETINISEPLSYNFSKSTSGDLFSFIETEDKDPHKSYKWSDINENIAIPTTEGTNVETRTKILLPDVSSIKTDRDLELQNYLSMNG
jgi:hypothetical protein